MNLLGSIIERQNALAQIYHKLEDRFLENSMIRALWNGMAQDISKQIDSLQALPASFWMQFKKDSDRQLETSADGSNKPSIAVTEVISLKESFNLTLLIEETLILSTYIPIIRNLRKNLTNPALDFYIMVKSHVARIVSVIESFAGDPVLIQRAHLLLQKFEKEVQEHAAIIKPAAKDAPVVKDTPVVKDASVTKDAPLRHAVPHHKPEEKPRKSAKPSSQKTKKAPTTKNVKKAPNRTKTLAKKVVITRKRAQR
jgi:hypothetical protein